MQALFEQAGVIRVDTLSELFDTALLLAYQPLPRGPRVAVVGNSTALGVLVSDALLDEGLELAGPGRRRRRRHPGAVRRRGPRRPSSTRADPPRRADPAAASVGRDRPTTPTPRPRPTP